MIVPFRSPEVRGSWLGSTCISKQTGLGVSRADCRLLQCPVNIAPSEGAAKQFMFCLLDGAR